MSYAPVATTADSTCDICREFGDHTPDHIFFGRDPDHSVHKFIDMSDTTAWMVITKSKMWYDCKFPHNYNKHVEQMSSAAAPIGLIRAWLKGHTPAEPIKVDNGETDYYRDSHNMLKDIINKLQDDVVTHQKHAAEQARLVESVQQEKLLLQQEKAALHSQVQMLMQLLLHKSQSE